MNEHVELPALRGEDPLGFLASVGSLQILTNLGIPAALSWEPSSGIAIMSGVSSIDELVELVAPLAGTDSLVPGLADSWIPKKKGTSGADPARIDRGDFADRVAEDSGWASALWTDLAVDDKRLHSCVCTPFYAPAGQSSMRSMFEKASELVAERPTQVLREAWTAWRRKRGFTGEWLDIRALQEAGESQDGKSQPNGVPGPVWLAWAGLRVFRMSGDGVLPTAVGWSIRPRSPKRFAWPLWDPPLELNAVSILVDHPSVAHASSLLIRRSAEERAGGTRWTTWQRDRIRTGRELQSLGVFSVAVAKRTLTSGGKSDGVLVVESAW